MLIFLDARRDSNISVDSDALLEKEHYFSELRRAYGLDGDDEEEDRLVSE